MDKPVSEPTAPAEPPLSLERENEQFRMESGRIDAIVSASNRMAKDAERYRWLREMSPMTIGSEVFEIPEATPEQLDAAIDDAMRG